MATVREIYTYLNVLAPEETQESWDNSGFLVGDPNAEVKTAVFTLDITPESVEASKEYGADLIISHHPVIFKPVSRLRPEMPVYQLVNSGIAAICLHTPLDIAKGGVNDVLCNLFGLYETERIGFSAETALLRMGNLPQSMDAVTFASHAKKTLNAGSVRYTDSDRTIKKLAVCGGAGASYLEEAAAAGADALLTGDAAHHDFLHAQELGICLLAAGHYATEFPAIEPLAVNTAVAFPSVKIVRFRQEDPVKYK